jgi:plasmid stabilization system protein ParE
MILPVILRPDARREFDDAFDWYNLQRPGLGAEFVACVEEAFQQIARAPELRAKVHRNVRRAPVRRFPYSIYYTVEADRISVIAVFHSKRNPRVWQSRV